MGFDLTDLEGRVEELTKTVGEMRDETLGLAKRRCEGLEHDVGLYTLELQRVKSEVQKARIWIVGALDHTYLSCNPGESFKCFLCESIRALLTIAPEWKPEHKGE